MSDITAPTSHLDLLEEPYFAHLATIRPDGSPQTNVMWFSWDGEHVRFSHTTTRAKYRNLQAESRVALSIADPNNQYRYLEVRGTVDSIVPDDETSTFFLSLKARYGRSEPITDSDVRVIVSVLPTRFIAFDGRMTEAERGWR
jgi:PPOX class probable F420-dependent enzyme